MANMLKQRTGDTSTLQLQLTLYHLNEPSEDSYLECKWSFPRNWKLAVILMIHKPMKREGGSESYRPIRLLPFLSKLSERLIANRIKNILRQRNILPDHQFRFREGHGIIERVHRQGQHILQAFDDCEYSNAVFIYMQQALDKVWHVALLCKIWTAPYFCILKSYLKGREFNITVRSNYSS